MWGVGAGVLLFGLTAVLFTVWTQFVPENEIAQQQAAAEQVVQSFNTLPLAFLISACAAVSEEILFRGAVQPVFGLLLTSLLFALFHNQYAFTPATLIILIVGMGLGWLRQRRNTTTSIIAHFVYNFIQLTLAILVGSTPGGF
jgi:membrane protease YdiL (CAAX protease family)